MDLHSRGVSIQFGSIVRHQESCNGGPRLDFVWNQARTVVVNVSLSLKWTGSGEGGWVKAVLIMFPPPLT